MDVKIEGDALTALIQKATVEALGKAGQEALIKEVVRHLTTKTSGGYGTNPSPLMKALADAAEAGARKFFEEKLQNDAEMIAAFESLYTDAFKRFNSTENRTKTVENMARRLSRAFAEEY